MKVIKERTLLQVTGELLGIKGFDNGFLGINMDNNIKGRRKGKL